MTVERSPSPSFFQALSERFGASVQALEMAGEGRWNCAIAGHDLLAITKCLLHELSASLTAIVGNDERQLGRNFRLYHVFNLPNEGAYLTLVTEWPSEHPSFPSLSLAAPAVNWAEREVQDLLGLKAVAHPDPRGLVLYEDWPSGVYPLRKDFKALQAVPVKEAEMDLVRVEGPGVFEVPVGPVHAGIIEPGHFRFSVDGEHVIHLEARLFWKHKGIEKRAEGRSFQEGLMIAERVCGACSVANSLAYCQAVEALTRCEVPARAQYLRVVAAEMERLYNHAGDMGGMLTDVAFSAGASHAMRIRENLLQLNEVLAGNRLLMGFNALGGVKRDIDAQLKDRLFLELGALRRDMAHLVNLSLSDESVLDRFETTGTLSAQTAHDLGVLGPSARASGIGRDVRRDHPYAAYAQLNFKVPVESQGDVLARFRVKACEFQASVALIKQALGQMQPGPLTAPLGTARAGTWALGATESARGENLHWVMADEGGKIYRYKVRTSSYMNWPALPQAVLGNIVPDFPLVNKSFNLCYACTDR